MPDGDAKNKLNGFLHDIRALIHLLKTDQEDQLRSFKQEKVNTGGRKLARCLQWQSMVT